jgi:hypothetical protein
MGSSLIRSAPAVAGQDDHCRCTFKFVSPLDAIIEDLKLLHPKKLRIAADLVSRLKGTSEEERQAALARTSGCLSQEGADAMEQAIEDGCERIDEDGWRLLS